jgi:nucleotide-binding universal stress UspA family protein
MKTILVPTDFSDCSLNALDFALQIAQKQKAKIILHHIVEPVQSYVAAADGMYVDVEVEQKYLNYLTENAKEKLKEITQSSQYQGVEIERRVNIGSLYLVIQEQVKNQQIDLIVMGTQGVSGLDEMFVGSNTEKVVRLAKCPVLTINKTAKNINLKKIVLATDLNPSNAQNFEVVRQIQNIFGAKVHIVFVNEPNDFRPQRDLESAKNQFISQVNLQNVDFQVYCDVNLENGILHFADDVKADLIAIATHQRKGLAHLISGSIAEDIVNHAQIPVLTFSIN